MKALKELLGLRRRTNTLTLGKLADLAVFSQDIFKVPSPGLTKPILLIRALQA
jgi:predicted amidohydrolase YtcJ